MNTRTPGSLNAAMLKKRLGKYEIIAELGHGAMGTVYKAQDQLLGRYVALKVMNISLMDEPELRKRFYREAQAAGNLRHPNIVTIYELGEEDGIPYIAMEFIDGQDVAEIIKGRISYTVWQKLDIMIQVCNGLHYAHRQGIVHRDVKPANVRVQSDGVVKIVDFGIAHVAASTLTRPGLVIGTISYMSPEQIQGLEVDWRSDIFSVGVVLYELLTYQKPFAGDNMSAVLMKIISEDPPPVTKHLHPSPAGLDEILRKALAKRREDRYQSMDELATDLMLIREEQKQKAIQEFMESGIKHMQAEQWDEAQETFQRILQIDTGNRQAKQLLSEVRRAQREALIRQKIVASIDVGHRLMQEGDYDGAIISLQEALRIDPSNDQAKALLREARIEKESKERREKFTEHINLARRLFSEGNLTQARSEVEKALDLLPEDLEAKSLLDTISGQIERKERERKVAELIARAVGLIGQKNYMEAIQILKSALELDPDNPEAIKWLNIAEDEIQSDRRRTCISEALARARKLLGEKQYEDAIKAIEGVLAQYPKEPELLSLLYLVRREWDAEKRRIFVAGHLSSARGHFVKKEYAEAIKILTDALKEVPNDPELKRFLELVEREKEEEEKRGFVEGRMTQAKDHLANREYKEAISVLEEALAAVPKDPNLEEMLRIAREDLKLYELQVFVEEKQAQAKEFLDNKDYRSAIKLLEEALRRFPEEPELKRLLNLARQELELEERLNFINEQLSLAKSHRDAGNYDDAIEALEQALNLTPAHPSLEMLLGQVKQELAVVKRRKLLQDLLSQAKEHVAKGDLRKAANILESACNTFPDEPLLKEQLRIVRAALEAEERNAFVSEQLKRARTLLQSGQHKEAIKILKTALDKYPSDPALREQLQVIEKKLEEIERLKRIEAELARACELVEKSKYDEAIEALEAVSRAYPDEARIIELLNKISEKREKRRALTACIDRTRILLRDKKFDEATLVLQNAKVKFPDEPLIDKLMRRTRIELKKAQLKAKAQRALRRASELKKPAFSIGALALALAAVVVTIAITSITPSKYGTLVINTSPEGVSVMIDGKHQGTTKGGTLEVRLKAEEAHRIVLRKDGYSEVHQEVKLEAGQSRRVAINLSPLQPLPSPPLPSAALVRVTSSPPGASIYVDGDFKGTTPQTGVLILSDLKPKLTTIRAVMEGYYEDRRDVGLSAGEARDISLVLRPKPATLVIRSNAREALVEIDGRRAGSTNGEGAIKLDNIAHGIHNVAVRAEGYEPWQQAMELRPGEVKEIVVQLSKVAPATLYISSSPGGALVLVDSQPRGTTSENATLEVTNLAPNKQLNVVLRKGGYREWRPPQPIVLKPGQSLPILATLQPLEGYLAMAVEPEGAKVTIRGEGTEEVYYSPLKKVRLRPGRYFANIEREGHESQTAQFEIADGRTTNLTIRLQSKRVQPAPETRPAQPAPETRPAIQRPPRFYDTFVEGTLDKWDVRGGRWTIRNGRLQMSAKGMGFPKGNLRYVDFSLTFDVRLVNGKSASWVVRAQQDYRNYYMFQINGPKGNPSNSFCHYICRNGNLVRDRCIPLPIEIKDDRWYHINLIASGNTFVHQETNFVRGELARWTDTSSTFSEGMIGFITLGDEKVEVGPPFIITPAER